MSNTRVLLSALMMSPMIRAISSCFIPTDVPSRARLSTTSSVSVMSIGTAFGASDKARAVRRVSALSNILIFAS